MINATRKPPKWTASFWSGALRVATGHGSTRDVAAKMAGQALAKAHPRVDRIPNLSLCFDKNR